MRCREATRRRELWSRIDSFHTRPYPSELSERRECATTLGEFLTHRSGLVGGPGTYNKLVVKGEIGNATTEDVRI